MTDREWEQAFAALTETELIRIAASDIDSSSAAPDTKRLYAAVMQKAKKEGENMMRNKKKSNKKLIAALIAAVLVIALLSVAGATGLIRLPISYENLHREQGLRLSENLLRVADPARNENGEIIAADAQVKTDGYTVTLEGVIRGSQYRNFSYLGDAAVDGYVDGLYAVVSIVRDDGGEILNGDDEKSLRLAEIGASPLIKGAWPNINVYAGMSAERETGIPQTYCEDNVLYLFVDITETACYADKGLYIAVYGEMVFTADQIDLDETGAPHFNANAPALNAVFELPLDESFADAEARRAFEHERPVAWPPLPFTYTGQDASPYFANPDFAG